MTPIYIYRMNQSMVIKLRLRRSVKTRIIKINSRVKIQDLPIHNINMNTKHYPFPLLRICFDLNLSPSGGGGAIGLDIAAVKMK